MAAAFTPHRQARRCDALGLSALGLGLAGIGLGLAAARDTWFVVVPVGLLTTIFGLIDVSRARHDTAANGPTAVLGIVAGAAALALGVWGTGMFLGELNQMSYSATTTRIVVPTWGQADTFASGLTVRVTAPTVTSPGSVVFTVTASNSSETALTVTPPTASFAGRPVAENTGAKPVTVAPHGSVTYRIGYHVPSATGRLCLEFRPAPGARPGIIAGAL
jgi:hypothetical protein